MWSGEDEIEAGSVRTAAFIRLILCVRDLRLDVLIKMF
jgi:hypothetical protein